MGMYDILNGEQVKIFYKPYITLTGYNTPLFSSCIGFSGGDLKSYSVGDEVPYKRFSYNYGKDFNVIDFFPYNHDDVVIHMIRDGKNLGVKDLKDIHKSELAFDAYDDHGNRINIHSTHDIKNYICMTEEINQIKKNETKYDAFKEWSTYARNHKNDIDYKDKYKELYFKYKVEQLENDKVFKKCYERRQEFALPDRTKSDFEIFGALIIGLNHSLFDDMLKPDAEFFVNDTRLDFLYGYNELKIFLQKKDFVDEYLDFMDFSDKELELFKRSLDKIKERFEILQKTKYQYTQFNGQYVLSEILNGKYKDLYLKFNLCPYEGFDYNDWKYCKQDIEDKEDDIFQKELDDYCMKRFQEENIER